MSFLKVSRLGRLLALTPRDVALLAEAWLTLLWWRIVVQLRGSWAFRKALSAPLTCADTYADDAIGRIAALLGIASRHHFVNLTCFHRSLALCTLLRRRRIAAAVRVTVWKKGNVDITGHAWVEVDGKVVGDLDSLAQSPSLQLAR